jgi:hypothetical protein
MLCIMVGSHGPPGRTYDKDDQVRETFRKTIRKCKYPTVVVDGRSLNLNLVYELNNDRRSLHR